MFEKAIKVSSESESTSMETVTSVVTFEMKDGVCVYPELQELYNFLKPAPVTDEAWTPDEPTA